MTVCATLQIMPATESLAPVLALRGIDLAYAVAPVLRSISLTLAKGEFVSLVGASGCGKSSLLNIVAGLTSPTAGDVLLDGRAIDGPGPDRAMVFQDDAVFPWMTVEANIEYPLRVAGLGRTERRARVEQLLRMVRLDDKRHAWPRQLSGGQRKRVDIARALAAAPALLLMDEPFAALDAMTKAALQAEFLAMWEQSRLTVLFVTHDLEEALLLSDRILLMTSSGRIDDTVTVPFPRPRAAELRQDPAFQSMRHELTRGFQLGAAA
jgi:NitT/TauT family transport system ATP-binding protein